MALIERRDSVATAVCSDAVADSESVDLRNASSGIVMFTADPGDAIDIFVSHDDSDFNQLVTSAGAALQLGSGTAPVANTAIPLPDELFAAHFLRLEVSGSDVTGIFMLKG